MNNLTPEIIHKGKFNLINNEVEFEAHYDDYYATGSCECDIRKCQDKEEDVGLMHDGYQLDGVNFWLFNIMNDAGIKISIPEDELRAIKNDIENYFDELTQRIN